MFDETIEEHTGGNRYDLTDEGYLTDQEAASIAGTLGLSLPVERQTVVDATSAASTKISAAEFTDLTMLEVWAEFAESDLLKGEPLRDGSPFTEEP